MGALISVIIPVYNTEKYLRRCVDSVLNQTYTDLEVILIDDGSTDGSADIIDTYAKKDKRVVAVHEINGGAATARNTGLDNAHGEYVTFIDSDDWVDERYLEILYEGISSGAEVAEIKYIKTGSEDVAPVYDDECDIKSGKDLYDDRDYFFGIYSSIVCCKLYSIKVFDGLRFADRFAEDTFTAYKAVYPCKQVARLNAEVYYYFDNVDSLSTSTLKSKQLDLIEAYIEQYKYFEEAGDLIARDYAAEKIYYLISYYYALSLRSGVDGKEEIKAKLKKYYREYYKKFKRIVKVKAVERMLIKLSCGKLAFTYPVARHRRNRIK